MKIMQRTRMKHNQMTQVTNSFVFSKLVYIKINLMDMNIGCYQTRFNLLAHTDTIKKKTIIVTLSFTILEPMYRASLIQKRTGFVAAERWRGSLVLLLQRSRLLSPVSSAEGDERRHWNSFVQQLENWTSSCSRDVNLTSFVVVETAAAWSHPGRFDGWAARGRSVTAQWRHGDGGEVWWKLGQKLRRK